MIMIRGRFRAALLMGAAASVLAFAAGAKAQNQNSNDNPWPYAKTDKPPVLAVVGDVSCQPDQDDVNGPEASKETCETPKAPYSATNSTPPGPPYSLWQSQQATATQIENMKPDAVAILGDLQYQVGQYQDFENSYNLTFGSFKKITRPAPGNHEFYNEHGAIGLAGYGYFSYFNGVQQITTSSTTVGTSVPADTPLTATINGIPELVTPTAITLGSVTIPPGTPVMATVTGVPFTDGTFTQPIPNSDGQAGHFEQAGASQYDVSGISATYADGPSAGDAAPVGVGDGWYSYNLGAWHLISLNIECETQPGNCPAPGTGNTGTWFNEETEWLKNDLAADHSPCTLAYWHQPTISATDGLTEEGITAGTWWKLLYDAGADLILNGHDHLYARYQPLKPYYESTYSPVSGVTGTWLGTPDPKKGIVEFIVGTGGETLDPIVTSGTTSTDSSGALATFNAANLKAYSGDYWGVMALTLNNDGYAWNYQSALAGPAALAAVNGPTLPAPTNGVYSDKGLGTCHGGPFGYSLQGNNFGGDDQGR